MFIHASDYYYTWLEMYRAAIWPVNFAAKLAGNVQGSPFNPLNYSDAGRALAATFELTERLTRNYGEPEWDIPSAKVDGQEYPIKVKTIKSKPFCKLLNFQKQGINKEQPRLLIVAPLSGHYATLLRGTVRDTLPHYDVYITDWENARDVPVTKGKFDLDDYIDYLMEFMRHMGKGYHMMAVCQPSVPAFAAVSLMSAEQDQAVPHSLILIGGPIDTRINPTDVNHTAEYRPIEWFERHVISVVPANYPGFMRRVYPGFIQLTGFMTMNLDRHLGEHFNLFLHLTRGDGDSAEAHRKFYNEYLSVLDLTAEFYLQTVDIVFKQHALPKGTWISRERPVRPDKITKTGIMAIEGELDDISGVGQTKAALKLAGHLPDSMKCYHKQKGVGHYGSFNGRKFRDLIVPEIVKFTTAMEKKEPTQRRVTPLFRAAQ